MYTGYIVKAGETCKDERVAKAIKHFGYENETIICIGEDGHITEVDTIRAVRSTVGEHGSPDEYLAAYLDKLNNPTTVETIE